MAATPNSSKASLLFLFLIITTFIIPFTLHLPFASGSRTVLPGGGQVPSISKYQVPGKAKANDDDEANYNDVNYEASPASVTKAFNNVVEDNQKHDGYNKAALHGVVKVVFTNNNNKTNNDSTGVDNKDNNINNSDHYNTDPSTTGKANNMNNNSTSSSYNSTNDHPSANNMNNTTTSYNSTNDHPSANNMNNNTTSSYNSTDDHPNATNMNNSTTSNSISTDDHPSANNMNNNTSSYNSTDDHEGKVDNNDFNYWSKLLPWKGPLVFVLMIISMLGFFLIPNGRSRRYTCTSEPSADHGAVTLRASL